MIGPVRTVRLAMAFVLAVGAAAQDANVVERIGKRFRVEFHAGAVDGALAGTIAEQALATVEGAWPGYKKLLGAKDQKPTTIVLYRDDKDYRVAEKGGPWPFRVEGFLAKDGRGHVLLFPVLSDVVLARVCLPPAAREELLRIAAEIVVRGAMADTGVAAFDVDDWLCWVLTMGALEAATNPTRKAGLDAAYDTRRARVRNRVAEGNVYALDTMQNPDLAPKERYLWEWMLTDAAVTAELCADSNAGWAKKMLAKPKLPKGRVDKFTYREAAMAVALGDLGKADIRFTKQQRAYAPLWEQRSPSWGRDGDRWMLAVGEGVGSVIVLQSLPAGDYAICHRLEVGAGKDSVRILLTSGGNTVLGVVFWEDLVALSVWDTEKKKWSDKAVYRPETAWPGSFDVRAEITAASARVLIDGIERVAWKHGGLDLHHELALEATDRVAWFENLRVEPLTPAKK